MIKRHANLSFAESQMTILPQFRFAHDNIIGADRQIIFIHPPKVAGTNLTFLMSAIAQQNSNIRVKRFTVPRVVERSPNLITKGWIGGLEGMERDLIGNQDLLKNVDFMSGHFPLGIHKFLNRNFKYFALIRDPVDREISSLNFDYQRGFVNDNGIDYLMDTMIDNPQTRMLAGVQAMNGECTAQTLDQAIENIDQYFAFIAPHAASFEIAQTLSGIFNAGVIALARSQVTQLKLIETVPENLKQQLLKKHKFDKQLHEYAKQVWNNWKQENVAGCQEYDDKDECLVIDRNFSSTKCARKDKIEKIREYNQSSVHNLIETSQLSSEMPKLV